MERNEDDYIATNKLSMKKILKHIVKSDKSTKDIISLILIINNLEEERVTVEGNDHLKPIKDLNHIYVFFLGFLPEKVVKSFIPKSQLPSQKKRDSKKAEKENEEEEEMMDLEFEEENDTLTVENKAFIMKYLLLFASIYSKIENKNDVDIDMKNLIILLSIAQTQKIGVKILSLLLASLRTNEMTQNLVNAYIQQNCRRNKSCIGITLHSMVALISYSEIKTEQILKISKSTISTCRKMIPKQYQAHCHKFVQDVCKKYKVKLLKNKSDASDKIVEEVVSNSYLRILEFLFNFIN